MRYLREAADSKMNLTGLFGALLIVASHADRVPRPPAPTPNTPVDYVKYVKSLVEKPGCENAFESYDRLTDVTGRSLFKLAAIDDDLETLITNVSRGGPAWRASDQPELAALIERNDSRLQLFCDGTRLPCFWRPLNESSGHLFEAKSPFYVGCRDAYKLVLARAWEQCDNQNSALIEAWTLLLRHASQIQGGGTLIDALTSGSSEKSVMRSVLSAIAIGTLSEGRSSSHAFTTLEKAVPRPLNMELILKIEWAEELDRFQYLCPKGRADMARWQNWEQKHGRLP